MVTRGIGLLGRSRLSEGDGLLLTRSSMITMIFMRFAIDALFIDRDGRVLRIARRLRPWIPFVGAWSADAVLELPAGAAQRSGTQVGDVIRIS